MDLKFIGMQIVIEGLALSAFNTTRETTPRPGAEGHRLSRDP